MNLHLLQLYANTDQFSRFYMDSDFTKDINKLIESKREGPHWDFKEKHHENRADLLHDILCLSNALYKGNKYLIFGVNDPSAGCEIKGVNNDANRKVQAGFIGFLRNKSFAGDISPEIELRNCLNKRLNGLKKAS